MLAGRSLLCGLGLRIHPKNSLVAFDIDAYDVFFVYPDELRASKRIAVFRDFLLSKVAGWEF